MMCLKLDHAGIADAAAGMGGYCVNSSRSRLSLLSSGARIYPVHLWTIMAGGAWLVLLIVSICLGGYSSLLSHLLELARQQSAVQQSQE
jgi:hypothetical protein